MQLWALALFLLLARLTSQADGDLDSTFAPNLSSYVFGTAVQPDGMILIGGAFTSIDGTTYNHMARLNADGTADSSFNTDVNGTVYSIAVQADGKILVGGQFSLVGGVSCHNVARLNPDGSTDSSFNPNASSTVYCLAVQADGKILLGGYFTTVGGGTYNCIARLNADGTADGTFNNPNVSGVYVASIAIQADGKILLGGPFTKLDGVTYNHLARLNADGTVDSSFNPNVMASQIDCVAVQADGRILIGGDFTTVGGTNYNRIARLNPDGTADSSFNPNADRSVLSMAVQADGKILVAGGFVNLGGASYNYIARLNADGTADSGFSANTAGTVNSIVVQADGQVLIGGLFSSVDGTPWSHVARLYNWGANQALSVPDNTQVQWLRSGPEPEVSLVTFESSTNNGVTWTALGNGTRITGGWQLTGLSLPSSVSIRARGRASGGYFNGSSGLIEQTNSFTGVVPPVTLNAVAKGGKLVLSWPYGVLQAAGAVRGVYTNVPNAISPFTNSSMTLPQLYYRVKVH
jgi:uncharacterized delta-60 repeat protein